MKKIKHEIKMNNKDNNHEIGEFEENSNRIRKKIERNINLKLQQEEKSKNTSKNEQW